MSIYTCKSTSNASCGNESNSWVASEVRGCHFKDERLKVRFETILRQLSEASAQSIPWACQDWASTKAAYRFFDNERVCEEDILSGHFSATRDRFDKIDSKVLVLHDTTQLSYRRENIGILHTPRYAGNAKGDRWREENPLCGISMHSSMVITTDGLPLGLAAIKFWTRKEFKGTNALKRKINPTRVPIDQKESLRWLQNMELSTGLLAKPERCIHIGDRESDIFELYCTAQSLGTFFLIRICANRLVNGGSTTMDAVMEARQVKGLHNIEIQGPDGHASEAILELKFCRMRVLPPAGKRSLYPEQTLTVIHATERGTPKGRERIEWKLATNLPVTSRQDIIEKLSWYALRWKIEVFHKVLKSGYRVEESRLRSATRLVNLIATCCITSWRIFWITMANRSLPESSPEIALTEQEIAVLDQLLENRRPQDAARRTLSTYVKKIAMLGGYLNRNSDAAPGNIVMWRGLSRLTDVVLGASISSRFVGN